MSNVGTILQSSNQFQQSTVTLQSKLNTHTINTHHSWARQNIWLPRLRIPQNTFTRSGRQLVLTICRTRKSQLSLTQNLINTCKIHLSILITTCFPYKFWERYYFHRSILLPNLLLLLYWTQRLKITHSQLRTTTKNSWNLVITSMLQQCNFPRLPIYTWIRLL
jgi:cytochrome c oxidase subunit IV